MNKKKWKKLEHNLILLKQDFQTKLLLYKDLLKPEEKGKLHTAHSNFGNFYKLFGIYMSGFIYNSPQDPNDWRETIHSKLAKDLANYFESVHELINVLEEDKQE